MAGVIVPGVNSAAEAAALVQAARFPPESARSTGLSRAVLTGGPERPLLLPMVETAGALADVEQIAALPGVDGVFVGPYELSLSLGRPGVTDEQVVSAIGRVREAAVAAGLLTGIFSGDRELDALLPPGLDLVALDTDVTVLRHGMQMLLAGDRGAIGPEAPRQE
nr:aldolase/citrate lyase family protein [Serinicoccus profundi]